MAPYRKHVAYSTPSHARRRWRLLGSGLALVAGQAVAQTNSPAVEEVVVTSSRVPIPLRQIGTSVSVIDATDIEAHGNLVLTDVLRQLPAIAISSSGGAGKSTSLRIRGEEGFRTLTIFDGLRLTDPSGPQVGPQLEHLLTSGIGRVEILRGPQGLSYGADAGGVVNISSRRSDTGLQASLDVQAGAYGTRQLSANVGGSNKRADFFVSLADFDTDGFNARDSDNVLSDDDGYQNTTWHARGGVSLSEQLRLDLVHRNVEGDAEHDGCFMVTTVHDCRSLFDMRATRVALDYTGTDFTHMVSYNTTRTDRDNLALGQLAYGVKGELNRWEYVGSATNLPGFDLVFGADHEEALSDDVGRDNVGVYLEYLSDFSDYLFLTAGVRHDDNDDFGTNTSSRFSAAYLIDLADDATVKFRSSYGSGFRAPSPYEIAYNAGPNAFPPAAGFVLRQETSKGWELGMEYTHGGTHLEAVYFDQKIKNAIYFDLVGFSGYLQDVGASNSQGVELSGEWSVGERWHLRANYTYNDTELPNGEPRRRRPEDLFNIGVTWYGMSGRLNLNAFYRASRDSYDEVAGVVVPLQNFEVLDLSANFTLNDSLQLYARLENALDEQYQEIIGYHTADRAAYVGFRVNYAGP